MEAKGLWSCSEVVSSGRVVRASQQHGVNTTLVYEVICKCE